MLTKVLDVRQSVLINHLLSGVVLFGLVLLVSGRLWADNAVPAGTQLSSALPAAEITKAHRRLNLIPYMALLEDKTASLSFEQVQQAQSATGFHPVGDHSPNFGFTSSAWWVKFRLHNPLNSDEPLVIRQDYPLIDFFDVWYSRSGEQWQHVATGDRRNFDQRPLDNRTFLIPVKLAPGETAEVYARFETQGSMNIGLFAHSNNDVIDLVGREYLALGVYYGGFLVLIVYNLIMFLSVREKAFAYYLLYVLCYGLYMSVHNGISFQYLWPNNVWLANQSLIILLALSLFWALRFTRTILSTDKLAPVSDKVAGIMEWVSIGCLLISPLVAYHTMIIPIAFLTVIICGHMMTMGVQTALRGSMPARYYLIAFTTLLLGVFVYMMKTFGLLPHTFWTQNSFQVGSLVEMVLLSLAIASRVSEIKRQSYIDALTRLYNRRYLNDQLSLEMHKAQRNGQPLTLAVIDIDNFKQFNDTHGHATGDEALKMVARILNETIRKPFTPCRYGGEEFVLVLPNTSDAAAGVIAERVRRQIEDETADALGLTVSIGYASTECGDFEHEQELFEAADFALYRAKDNGRNQVVNFSREDDRRKAVPVIDPA